MAPVPFVLFCCVFSSGDLRVVAVWPGYCLCLSGFALNCRTKVFHIVCFSFTRFSHCWNRASEQNRPQYRKKKALPPGVEVLRCPRKNFRKKKCRTTWIGRDTQSMGRLNAKNFAGRRCCRFLFVLVFCLCFHDMPQL